MCTKWENVIHFELCELGSPWTEPWTETEPKHLPQLSKCLAVHSWACLDHFWVASGTIPGNPYASQKLGKCVAPQCTCTTFGWNWALPPTQLYYQEVMQALWDVLASLSVNVSMSGWHSTPLGSGASEMGTQKTEPQTRWVWGLFGGRHGSWPCKPKLVKVQPRFWFGFMNVPIPNWNHEPRSMILRMAPFGHKILDVQELINTCFGLLYQ